MRLIRAMACVRTLSHWPDISRSEVTGLYEEDHESAVEMLIVRNKVKGGDYVGREVRGPQGREALFDYLECCGG
jgi:hypothetical protein